MPKIELRLRESESEAYCDPKIAFARVEHLLSNSETERPTIFQIEMKGSGTLDVGIGYAEGVLLQHVPEDGLPPYMASINPHRPAGATVEYFLHGVHHTEVCKEHLIAFRKALNGIQYFLQSGLLSSEIEWTEI